MSFHNKIILKITCVEVATIIQEELPKSSRDSRCPVFDWSCTFQVSGERKNVVVKVLHRSEDLSENVSQGYCRSVEIEGYCKSVESFFLVMSLF